MLGGAATFTVSDHQFPGVGAGAAVFFGRPQLVSIPAGISVAAEAVSPSGYHTALRGIGP